MMGNQSLFDKALHTRNIVCISVVIECLLFYFYYFPEAKVLMGDEPRYMQTGLSIANGADWHSNPLWPPMQPVLISLFARIFEQPLLPIQIFQYLMLLAAGFIVRDITWRETTHHNAAQWSLAIMLWYPSWLAYSQFLWPEVVHVLLFVVVLWIINYRNHSQVWMILSGILLGLAIVFKSLIILFVPVLFMPLFRGFKKPDFVYFYAVKRLFLCVIFAVLVIAPASFKAHKMTGGWMVSNSSMFNLWYGLKDNKRQHFIDDKGGGLYHQYMRSGEDFKQRNDWVKQQSLDLIKDQGVVKTLVNQLSKQYFRLFDHQTFFSQQFTGQKSQGYKSSYHRHKNDILVKLVVTYDHFFYAVIVVTTLLGLIIGTRQSLMSKQLALFTLYTLGLFLLLHAKPRFRIPLLPAMAFFSAIVLCYVDRQHRPLKTLMIDKKNQLILALTVFVGTAVVFAGGILDKLFPI